MPRHYSFAMLVSLFIIGVTLVSCQNGSSTESVVLSQQAAIQTLSGINVGELAERYHNRNYLLAEWDAVPGAFLYALSVANAAITEAEDSHENGNGWQDLWQRNDDRVAVYLSMTNQALIELYPQVLDAFSQFMKIARGGGDTADRDDSVILIITAHAENGDILARGTYNLYRQIIAASEGAR